MPPQRLRGVDPPVDALLAYAHQRVVRVLAAKPARDEQGRPPPAQPVRDVREKPVARHATGLSRARPARVGLALGGTRHVIAAGPGPRLQPLRPVRPVGFVPVGREPRVAPDLAADARRATAQHGGDRPDRGAVAHLDLDDLPFLLTDMRIHS